MNIAICDDDAAIIGILENIISQCCENRSQQVVCDAFLSGEELINEVENTGKFYQIYLLDIEMKQIDGLKTAHFIRRLDPMALIIFVTAHNEQVMEAFDVNAFHFLVKPINQEKARQVLVQAITMAERKLSLFTFKSNYKTQTMPFSEIICFEKQRRKMLVHTAKESYEFYCRTEDLMPQLDASVFVQVHHSYIVNMEYVRTLDHDNLILDNGKEIHISRKYKSDFKERYTTFIEMRVW